MIDLTFVSSYPSFFLDNVYAALHHYESVVDYETLHKAIFEYCEQDPDIRLFRRLTDISVLNLLIEMVSPEALEAVEKWKNDKKKNIYMKIANELASKLNAIEADFVLDFIELFPQKSRLLLILDIWAINRIAKCVLFASAHPTFITENDMISKI
uniref:BACK domain-containing protein n=1 Tax=Panagrolaimus sp. ES5 TaxID=591445 RepID=A0AC34GCL5_9BILA